MRNATRYQDVSVLSTAKNGLVYLTANDWALVADKADRKQFNAGEQIVQKGKPTNGIYLLLKGTATVQIPSRRISLALGPGQVCGEISFLDELPATANGSRFYHSLAVGLSWRLRELIEIPVNK